MYFINSNAGRDPELTDRQCGWGPGRPESGPIRGQRPPASRTDPAAAGRSGRVEAFGTESPFPPFGVLDRGHVGMENCQTPLFARKRHQVLQAPGCVSLCRVCGLPVPDGPPRVTPDPATGAIWGGVPRRQCGVDGEGARKREVSSFGGHGRAAMRRPEANRRRVSARRVTAGDMGSGIVGASCMARGAAARLRRAPGAGCRGSVPAGP